MSCSKFSWMPLWSRFGTDFSYSKNILPREKTPCCRVHSHSGTLSVQVKTRAPDLVLGEQLEQPRHSTMREGALAWLVPSALSRDSHPSKAKHSGRKRHPAIALVVGSQTIADIYFITRKQCLLPVVFLSLFCLEGHKRACLASV